MFLLAAFLVSIATDSHQIFQTFAKGISLQLLKTAGAEKRILLEKLKKNVMREVASNPLWTSCSVLEGLRLNISFSVGLV